MLVFTFLLTPALAEHTGKTKGGYQGMPPCCCNIRDCVPADVKFIQYRLRWAEIEVQGKRYRVMGCIMDRNMGIYPAPHEPTYWCPMVKDRVRCATVRPSGAI